MKLLRTISLLASVFLVLPALADGTTANAVDETFRCELNAFVEACGRSLRSDDANVKWNAALGLSFFESSEGISVINDGVLNPDPFRRWEAINALGRAHDERSIDLLRTALGSPSIRDRNEIVLTLGSIGGPAAVEILIGALSDEFADVRWRAAMALGKTRDRKALPALHLVAEGDASAEVREHARKAIAHMK